MTKSEKNKNRWLLGLLMLLGFGLLSYSLYRIVGGAYQQREIDREIAGLQKEIESLNQENRDLKEMVDYFQTEPFREKELKDKLDMIKDGEEMVYVREKTLAQPSESNSPSGPVITIEKPPYYYWWMFFFGKK